MYAASRGGKLSVASSIDCLTVTLMPTDSISSCTAVVPAGSGVGVGTGVAAGDSDGASLALSDGLGEACATSEADGSTMGGRLAVGPPPSRVPM
jgi:hypothetical protein